MCTGLVGNIKRKEGSDIITLILGFLIFFFFLYLLKDGASPFFPPLSIYSFTLFHLMSFSIFPSCLVDSPFQSCHHKYYGLFFSCIVLPSSFLP